MKQKTEFLAATGNAGKLEEINGVLRSIGYGCTGIGSLGIKLTDPEDGSSFYENAMIKAKEARRKTGRAVLADDSGLMVDALGGAPGVHTARYAGEGATDDENMDKLLAALGDLPAEERTARFVSCVVAILPDGRVVSASGVCEGWIGTQRHGEYGFGYDPIFYMRGGRTLSDLTDEKRYTCSHRARALRKLAFKLRGIRRMKYDNL